MQRVAPEFQGCTRKGVPGTRDRQTELLVRPDRPHGRTVDREPDIMQNRRERFSLH